MDGGALDRAIKSQKNIDLITWIAIHDFQPRNREELFQLRETLCSCPPGSITAAEMIAENQQ